MNKTYAFTDIHGRYELWKQIKEYCDETDTLYFLGDACDRGDHGLRIIRELLADKRVIYLKGNHEDFLGDIGADIACGHYVTSHVWRMNGGFSTMQDFEKCPIEKQEWYVRKMTHLPVTATYINKKGKKILLSHAGYTPSLEPTVEKDYYWDRDHIFSPWWPKEDYYKDMYIVHGHTPVDNLKYMLRGVCHQYKSKNLYSPVYYCGGHKIDLDLASFETGKAVLFDLDTLTVAKTFYDATIEQECE